jgi:hypothetical protein
MENGFHSEKKRKQNIMNTELMTDDEALRLHGMTDGPKQVSRFKLRPVTALSLSWMQRNRLFEDDFGDMLMKTAAFAFLHSEDKAKIRSVVNDRIPFLGAVDEWMDDNIKHHSELEPISQEMNDSLDRYMAAITTAANPSESHPNGIKN